MQTIREEMNEKFNNILSLISDNPKLVNVKRDILEKNCLKNNSYSIFY